MISNNIEMVQSILLDKLMSLAETNEDLSEEDVICGVAALLQSLLEEANIEEFNNGNVVITLEEEEEGGCI